MGTLAVLGDEQSMGGSGRVVMLSSTLTAELTGLRVLVAEDDYFIALDVAECVEALGGEVIGPVDGAARGISTVNRARPDIALLDVQLRDGLVTPLAALLLRLDVPFGLITGYRGEALLDETLRRSRRLGKPFHRLALARMAVALRTDCVRRRAHAIWESEGRLHGQAERHWRMAEQTLRHGQPAGPGHPHRAAVL